MQIQVKAQGLPRTAQLRQLAVRKVSAALACYSQFIDAVNVRLEDINGPDRGGVDKLCRIVINFRHCSILVVEELGRDMEQVIAWVAERLPRNVSGHLGRLITARADRGAGGRAVVAMA